jgi:hypothetical protein
MRHARNAYTRVSGAEHHNIKTFSHLLPFPQNQDKSCKHATLLSQKNPLPDAEP